MTDKKKIIIVDDHNMFVDGLSSILSQEKDIEIVLTSSSAKQIVKYLSINTEEHIDLVITDINMPEMDGIEAIEEILKLDPNLLILVVSALADKATAIEAMTKGALGFLCKPFTEQQLTDALGRLISGAKK